METWEVKNVAADTIGWVNRHIETELGQGWDVVTVFPDKDVYQIIFKRLK